MSLTTLLSGSAVGGKPMRILRWAERLQEYNYDVVYRAGKDNCVADLLSRPHIQSTYSGLNLLLSAIDVDSDDQELVNKIR